MNLTKIRHEIEHGEFLAHNDAEEIWGWGTPAGQIRARRRAQMIADSANLKPGTYALEIGCGTGMFTEMFSQTGATLVAVDISGELLEKAKARGLPEDRIRFLEKPFEACDPEGPFDAVIGSSILHHLDIHLSLEKIHHLLRPGGVMSFAEPNMLNPQIMLQKNIPWLKKRLGDSLDETAFIRQHFAKLLSKTGFENIHITPFDWLHPATPVSLIPPVRSMGSFLEKIPFVREFAGSLHIQCCRRQTFGS